MLKVKKFKKKTKKGGHKSYDDPKCRKSQDDHSVFTLLLKSDFNTILACLGVTCIDVWELVNICRQKEIGGSQLY